MAHPQLPLGDQHCALHEALGEQRHLAGAQHDPTGENSFFQEKEKRIPPPHHRHANNATNCGERLGLLHHEAEQLLGAHGESLESHPMCIFFCAGIFKRAGALCFAVADHLEGVCQRPPVCAAGAGRGLPEALQAAGEGPLRGDGLRQDLLPAEQVSQATPAFSILAFCIWRPGGLCELGRDGPVAFCLAAARRENMPAWRPLRPTSTRRARAREA